MCQATLKRLSNRFESCQAQKVASLLTEALRTWISPYMNPGLKAIGSLANGLRPARRLGKTQP
jgi:hypothetical protein